MFEELEIVELTHDIKEHKLKVGDTGTVVFVYESASGRSKAYEVEFVAPNGRTIALLTLMPDEIRSSVDKDEYLSHGINPFIYASTASSMKFVVDVGVNEPKIKTETRKNRAEKEFHFSIATV